jgi:hypothetical protein
VVHEPPWYGTVCPVVWEDGGCEAPSYPMMGAEIGGICAGLLASPEKRIAPGIHGRPQRSTEEKNLTADRADFR